MPSTDQTQLLLEQTELYEASTRQIELLLQAVNLADSLRQTKSEAL